MFRIFRHKEGGSVREVWRTIFGFRIFLLLLLSPFPLHAQVPFARPGYVIPEEIAERLSRRISLDLRDIQVIDVLKFLSTKADLNIIASQNINAKVTLFLKDVSIGNALEIILISAGLAFREKEGIIYVMTEEEYAALYGEPYRDQREIKMIQVKYADPTKVGGILGGIKSSIGKIIIDAQTGTVVLIDTAEKIQLMEQAAERVDVPFVQKLQATESRVFELSYNKAEDLETQVRPYLSEGVGSVQIDKKTNRIFVTDYPNNLTKVGELVKAFDRKTREVYIETKIIQVTLSNEYQAGISWEQIVNQGPERNKFRVDSSGTFPISSTATQFGKVVIGDLGREDFLATVQMLHTFGDTKTLATPQLTVENGEEATILVGTREAYVTSTVSQAESTTTTSESITFIDVGVQLKVLPLINQDGFISLTIAPEISSVGDTLTTSNGNEIPIVDTTKSSTKVLIKDGHTVLIGGLMQDTVLKTVRKFPVLGDVPLMGAFFRSTDDAKAKTELVIFLTPHIVQGDEPFPFAVQDHAKPFEPLRNFE